ncbi:hypothetical protein FE782_17705 [Paenibacillus antri]|uniref:Holin-like toxin n=1 Tax=Paenibacillus antri TaxID=2582848 RepID=A0A5R9GCK4_9BACL|nr:hypothetical protein FE782_17705 [Paenibacillus antri]
MAIHASYMVQYGCNRESALKGGRLISGQGGDAMTVYEALSLMIAFGSLVVAMLSFDKKK